MIWQMKGMASGGAKASHLRGVVLSMGGRLLIRFDRNLARESPKPSALVSE